MTGVWGESMSKEVSASSEEIEQVWRDIDEAKPYAEASGVGREILSPEQYQQLVDEREEEAQRACEASLSWGELEQSVADGWDLWFQNCTHEEFVAFLLGEALSDEAKYADSPDRRAEFYEFVYLIREFLDGNRDLPGVLVPLAKAIQWQPRNDPATCRRFVKWCQDNVTTGPGDPDAYTQLVISALLLMLTPKDGQERSRDLTPQYIRLRRKWIGRRRRLLVPFDALGFTNYLRWFRNEVTRIIKSEILPDLDGGRSDAPLESREVRGQWEPSPVEPQQARKWREAQRANPDSPFHQAEHVLACNSITRTSADLRTLARQVKQAPVTPSLLQQRILDLAAEDPSLTGQSEVAERLGTTRGTVKSAIRRLRDRLKPRA
jgi:hypothetical protein